ncbi:amidohydrolase family protein [Mucilaginibacter sp. Bleaf8]|uniref:amidohydrolase family protein n=1 Tax=Mucilaginibacter sp. Bleaf8 TaxID=2834430 RepID=UPI001BD075A2|nr:amidohydrolase family protein [Mucilaginibacter sp. Bleaf8]MBS7564882.1 amidohydrolase family protein [Mucilaginibacter sp. Bleaf8]
MYKIDSHQHFWQFDPVRDSWITGEMSAIRRDCLPADLWPLLQHHDIQGCIAVQSDQSEKDNEFLLGLAADNDFIKGIVGWVDLQAADVEDRLIHYRQFEKIKGFRHVLQGEPQRDLMLTDAFKHGIGLLGKYDFTYDVLIFADQLKYTAELIAQYPNQVFIIDHIAKPDIKQQHIDDWKRDIQTVAQFPNVSCKVSGMVTEADWNGWNERDFEPYLDVVFEAFGTNRVLYGSDWPVCQVAGGYDRMIDIVKNYSAQLSAHEQTLFWGDNAARLYQIAIA